VWIIFRLLLILIKEILGINHRINEFIFYNRGVPGEIIQPGKTGFLVEPDNVEELVKAIAQIERIDRNTCRQQAEIEYSLPALGERMEQWFEDILKYYYREKS
jgi:UDP-glucose:tetrahydrobiopterin glucosyltransferase